MKDCTTRTSSHLKQCSSCCHTQCGWSFADRSVHEHIKTPIVFFEVVPKLAYAVKIVYVKLVKLWMKLHLVELRHGFVPSSFVSSCSQAKGKLLQNILSHCNNDDNTAAIIFFLKYINYNHASPVRKTSPSNFWQRNLTMENPIPLFPPVTWKYKEAIRYIPRSLHGRLSGSYQTPFFFLQHAPVLESNFLFSITESIRLVIQKKI